MLISTLVDRYEGERLNSPNDLVFRSDGSLYFTDPPCELSREDSDPAKELPFDGVFRLAHGKIVSNCLWGDDGKSLYITARTSVYRIKLPVEGAKGPYQ